MLYSFSSVGIEVLNIFFKQFFRKNNIFQNNSNKLFLEGMTIFERTGCCEDKNEYNLFLGGRGMGTDYGF